MTPGQVPLKLHSMASPPLDLSTLVSRIASGDERSLALFYQACASRVFGLVLRILGDRQVAEEVVVDTFTQVWRKAGSYAFERGDVLTWVLTIARHRAIDRRRQRQAHGPCQADISNLAEIVFAKDAAPDSASLARERASRVREAAAALPKGQREALAAAYFAGMTQTEIAATLGLPLGTVKTRIRDGMMALRCALADASEELQ